MGVYLFKKLFRWDYFRGSLFSKGLIIGGNFVFQNGLGFTIKTANSNSPWAYICSKSFFGGIIFGGAYFRRVLLLEGILCFKMAWASQ